MIEHPVLYISIKAFYGLLLSVCFFMTLRSRARNFRLPPRDKYYKKYCTSWKGKILDYLSLILLAGGGLLLIVYFPQNFSIATVACVLIVAGALCGNHIDNIAAKNQYKAETQSLTKLRR